jgi:alpha-beta hydrolase superfamily lysophospholipase
MTGSTEPQFLEVGTGAACRRIAYIRFAPATPGGPGLVWLIGLKSDMASTKAVALAEWAGAHGIGFTGFDYSGHGRSAGRFEEATIGDWLEESEAVFTHLTAGPQILVGSSTGGYLALLLLRRLMQEAPAEAGRIKGLVLIAPAWDVTEELMWKVFPDSARRESMEKGAWVRPSAYDERGYPITRRFIEEGRNHLFARQPFNPGRPVVILQGLKDVDVPPTHTRELVGFLEGGWAKLIEVPDGEHRLSRPQDLALLFDAIASQLGAASPGARRPIGAS